MYQIPQRRRLTKDSKWVTISDLKIQAVKEICYEVALNDFRHTRQEIEALAIVKMKELCAAYNKKDPNERDSWRAVARDVWDTVGVGDERIEDVITNGRGVTDMDDLKVHIDKLEDILHEVKKQNNTKDEEIRALRNKMLKMEQVIPLISNEAQEKPRNGGLMRARSSSEGKVPQEKPDGEQFEEPVCNMMENDTSFQRGRMQWMRQEQIRLKNLQQQEISKQLRRQNGPHRFIPPEDRKLRFPFKSNPKHRNSWTPGTHIIITDKQVIELKVPKEAVEDEENADEVVEPKEQVVPTIQTQPTLPSPMGPRRSKDLEQGLYNRQNQGQKLHERGRSNSFNNSQRSSDSEPLHSGNRKPPHPQQAFYQPRYNQNQPHHYLQHQYPQSFHYNTEGNNHYQHYPPNQHHNNFHTPPRMRRQMSAPNLKGGRETAV